MRATIRTERIDFSCRGIRCAAWLTLPSGPGPHPAVVLVHGLGATHEMMLTQYEQHFAGAGIRRWRSTTATPERRMANRANISR